MDQHWVLTTLWMALVAGKPNTELKNGDICTYIDRHFRRGLREIQYVVCHLSPNTT
jgi:hypothetical protein